jgi:Pyruvate/2-oxoacid:ferredoxin oxidoreductase delta subunit
MDWDWKLIERECTGCGICADLCPHDAILMSREMACPEPVPSRCTGCMVCTEQCPFDAIEVKQVPSAAGT